MIKAIIFIFIKSIIIPKQLIIRKLILLIIVIYSIALQAQVGAFDYGAIGVYMKPYTLSVPHHDISRFKLQVNGRIACDGVWSWSDQSLKKDITNLDTSLQKILSLRPVSYHFKPGIKLGDSSSMSIESMSEDSVKYATCVNDKIALDTDQTLHYGFIAQEIKTVFPNLVADIGNLEAVNYVELIPVLVKSIQ